MKRIVQRGVLVPLAVGVGSGAITLLGMIHDPRRALVGWIAAYGFAASAVPAAMILVMVLHVTGARWWLVLRRVFLAACGTAPLLVLLFVPIGAAFSIAYPWASPPPDLPHATSEALEHQRAWNHGGFFLARSAVYLGTWTALAVWLRRLGEARAESPSLETERRQKTLSAVGLPVMGFTMTFASFDWLMSLQPGWSSNIFGLYVFTAGLVTALSTIAIASWLAARAGLVDGMQPDHAHAIGRLMLMALILWAYIAFFQLMLIWIADLPSEVAFYVARSHGAWRAVDWILVAGRFGLPLFALLSRPLKRSPPMLAAVAGWLVVTSAIELAWITLPSLGAGLAMFDLFPFVAVAGLFWAYGVHLFQTKAPAPAQAVAPDRMREDALRYRSP